MATSGHHVWAVVIMSAVFLAGFSTAQFNQAPVWINSMQGFEIPENTEINTGDVIYTLRARDPDGDDTKIHYSLSGEMFTYNSLNGNVYLKLKLDYETKPSLRFDVTAEDEAGQLTTHTVTVKVGDANDLAPQFGDTTYSSSVRENARPGHVIIPMISVTDRDSVNLLLTVRCNEVVAAASLWPDVCQKFRINTLSDDNKQWRGQLLLNEAVDFEQTSEYQMPVTAFDGLLTTDISIEITLENVQDTPPRFVYIASTTVNEGQPIGYVVETVIAVDGDADNPRPIRYEIVNWQPGGFFQINDVNGSLYTLETLDREDPRLSRGYVDLIIKALEFDNVTGTVLDTPQTTVSETIRITVVDLNDNTPTFDQASYTVDIYENIPNQTPLPGVLLTVMDKDLGSASVFEFVLMNRNAEFMVDPVAGQGQTTASILVQDTTLIDYEVGPRQYILRVVARETNTTQRLSSTSTVTVNILDVNDNLPEFGQPRYQEKIKENTPVGTEVVKISAADPDTGILGTGGIVFELLGNGADLFNIEERTGIVTVAQCSTPGVKPCIDYENERRYDLSVIASDNNGQGQRVTVQLIIDIEDVNDNSPKFRTTDYVSWIEEGQTVPNPEVNVKASDPDSVGGVVTYRIITQDVPGLWQILPGTSGTGRITATRRINFHDTPQDRGYFLIVVGASDGKYNDARMNVRINVIDLNDNDPVFSPCPIKESIDERISPGTSVVTVYATDADSPTTDAGKLEYFIEHGAQGKFLMDKKTGIITISNSANFDYDLQKTYNMTVVARDLGQPQRTGSCSVIIDVRDVNNKDPYFDPLTLQTDVYENVNIGYSLFKLKAFDPDDDASLKFFFTEPKSAITPNGVLIDRNNYDYSNLFRVDEDTGDVLTNARLDRDRASKVTYTMEVVDIRANPQQTGTGTLIITILEFNDQPPEFRPFKNLTIDEEQPIGTFIMALLATDADDPISEYSLIINPFNFFAIGTETGVVSVNSRIDYETIDNPVIFRATVYDAGIPRLNTSTNVWITVRNINDNSPQFLLPSYQKRIHENSPNGTFVVQVSARDIDKEDYGVVRYSLSDSKNRFRIDSITGDITVAPGAVLDREDTPLIVVQVTAYDSPLDANVRRSTTAPVYIYLEDVNDNSPIFTQKEFYITIIETIPLGTEILQLFSTDADVGYNALLSFEKVPRSGDPSGYFQVGVNSGRISVVRTLLRHSGNYKFNVTARDEEGNGPFWDSAIVYVEVLEATNSPPEWKIPPRQNMTIYVLEEQYLGLLVYDVSATDQDSGLNGIVDYMFHESEHYTNKTAEFSINPITGVIRAERVFDREERDRYLLLLVARDRGDPFWETTRFLIVVILDVNDNVPMFPMINGQTKVYEFTVDEDADINHSVGQVKATDRDLAQYASIYYYIIGGNEDGSFVVNITTGEILVAQKLDREVKGIYNLNIKATNNISDYTVIRERKKRSADPSIASVIILVGDTNDVAPVFTQAEYHGCISTKAAFSESIVQVQAIDQDAFGSSSVRYNITGGNGEGAFTINGVTGIVSNIQLMNNIDPSSNFLLRVSARDNDAVKPLEGHASVRIFLTEPGNQLKLIITQSASEVRLFQDQLQRVLETIPGVKYICIDEIRDHILDDGSRTQLWADTYISAIYDTDSSATPFGVYSGDEIKVKLEREIENRPMAFDDLYIKDIEVSSTEVVSRLDRMPIMIVMIVIILLVFILIVFIIFACVCIRRMKQNKYKHLERQRTRPIQPVLQPVSVGHSINPIATGMYDNRGYEHEHGYGSDPIPSPGYEPEPEPIPTSSMEYARVQKRPATPESERSPIPVPGPESSPRDSEGEVMEVEIQDSPQASPHSSRHSSPRNEEFRIETDLL